MSNYLKVVEFMKAMGQEVRRWPSWPSWETVRLRCDLIDEEVSELHEGVLDRDLVSIADAIADILYVTYGMAAAFGMDADALFAEVHRSNMSKLGPDGKPIYREDGKILKPATYSPPNITGVLNAGAGV